MIREDVLERIAERSESGGVCDYSTNCVEDLVNEMFDDFDSRICKNCKHMRYPHDKTYNGYAKCIKGCASTTIIMYTNDNHFDNEVVEPNFGCNKFERKE